MVSGSNMPSLCATHTQPVSDGSRMSSKNAELVCRPTLHGRSDGFTSSHSGAQKDDFFRDQTATSADTSPSRRGVWQLQLNLLKRVRPWPLPSLSSITGQPRGPGHLQGQCHPDVLPVLSPTAVSSILQWRNHCSCSVRQSHPTTELRWT